MKKTTSWLPAQILFFIFFLTFFTLACQSKKPILVHAYDGSQICFGNGGGITGKEYRYCLLDNGQVYQIGIDSLKQEFITRIPKNQTKQIFSNYTQLKINKVNIYKPSNLYNFIQYKDEQDEHSIVWSKGVEISNELNIYYSILKKIIPEE